MTTYTPAVLVTGRDSIGNEFTFWKSPDGWVDGYNERIAEPEFIRHRVYPQVQKVYFSALELTGAQWLEAGCPLELADEQLTSIEEAYRAEVAAAAPEREAAEIEREANRVNAELVKYPARSDYDFTPFPSDMPDIDMDVIDEIPF